MGKILLFFLLLITGGVGSIYAESATGYDCGEGVFNGYSTSSCNQCFLGGTLYHGRNYTIGDYYKNIGTNNNYHKPGEYTVSFDNLQSGKIFFDYPSTSSLSYTTESGPFYFDYTASLGGFFFKFKPGEGVRLFHSNSSSPLKMSQVGTQADNNKFGLKITYDIKYYSAPAGTAPDLNQPKSHKECVFYNIAYCGDGILDTTRGEQCDLGSDNGKPGKACSSICQTVTIQVDCQPGNISGHQTSPIDQSTYGLCPSGQATDDFQSNTSGDTTYYTWSCNGSKTGGNCSANYNIPQSCIAGPTRGVQSSPISQSTSGLCPNGQSVGNFNSSTNAAGVTSYSWSCNGNSGGNCNATYDTNPSTQCIAGPTRGVQSSPISQSTSGLCPNGQSVGNFNSSTNAAGVTSYSWSCNGNSGGNCNATYDTNPSTQCIAGAGRPSGGVSTIALVSSSTLCQNGNIDIGSFASTVGAGGIINYTWTCGGMSGGNCNASYNPSGAQCVAGPGRPNGGISTVPLVISSTLCPIGQTVLSFTETPAGPNTTNYTRNCGILSGGDCNARYQSSSGGGECQNGGVVGFQGSVVTSSTPGLCPSGETVGNFSTSQIGNTTNCTWNCDGKTNGTNGTCYASYSNGSSGGSCQNGGVVGFQNYTITAGTPGLCTTGEPVSNFETQQSGNTVNCTRRCGGRTGGTCYGSYLGGTSSSSSSSSSSSGGGNNCGDGIIQSPNVYGTYEQCDLGSRNGQPGSGCDGNCKTSSTSSSGGGYCGDGKIQRPNGNGFNEECDPNTDKATWKRCDNSCEAKGTITNPGEKPGDFTITNPGESLDNPLSNYNIIVGHNTPLFGPSDKLWFKPKAGVNMYIPAGKPITLTNKSSTFISGDTITKVLPDSICYGDVYRDDGSKITCSNNPIVLFNGNDILNFKGNTNNFLATEIFRDTKYGINAIYPSQVDDTFYVSLGFFEEPLQIRVSKNAVSGISGGNAYMQNPIGYDVNHISNNFINNLKNGNFTTSSVNKESRTGQDLSSLTTTVISVNNINDKIEGNIQKTNTFTGHSFDPSPRTNIIINNLSNFESNYNLSKVGDINNTSVLKNGDLTITGSTIKLKGIKTVIIEDGDLIINNDIEYDSADKNASWAFVVKNGDIKINNTVKKIAGVFVVLGNTKGLKSNPNTKTANQLIVDGSIYGSASNLSDNRTFIRGTTQSSALTTGIIINYSTRALRNPPPLLTNFINQYNLNRIAR